MIIVYIMGGLGNQFFQYAFGRYLAFKHNTQLKLDITACKQSKNLHHNYYRLGEFNIQENFASLEEIDSLKKISENYATEINEVLNYPDNIFLCGYWQNERYFIDIRDILLQEMTLKNPLGKNSAKWQEKILNSACSVSLHLRFGDYLTPLIRNSYGKQLPLDYYLNSVNELRKDFSDITVFVFSDDLDCAKQILKFNVPIEFVEGCETDAEELYLMSICKHNIIPKSTFGWWGAWLNRNPDKKVFVTDSWAGRIKNAISISTKENARPLLELPPMLSVIVYVENNLSTVDLSLSSILSQNFSDYEVILIDASTDGSKQFCRKFGSNDNVTILNVNSSMKKFSAWNKALEVARGDYLLFLTAKEFMLQNVVKNLAQFHYDYLKQYLEPQKKYLCYENYDKMYPNLICMTQRLNEDNKGEINIGIPNKSFSLEVDEVFKNLNTFVEMNFPNNEKLLLLGAKRINPIVCTKFFKRKFLNENNIRFSETEGTDSELTFVVESFLKTEKITFMANTIIGRLE